MSSSTLDQDSIAALFAAAGDGTLPDEGAAEARASAPGVRTVDFRRPRQFTGESQRRLRRALETFCRTASSRLSAELRAAVDLEVISLEQLTWSDAHGQVPASSLTGVLLSEPYGTRMLLTAEQPLIVAAIERMLGGSGEDPPPQRRLSDIDTMLAGELFVLLVAQLSIIWEELVGATLTVDGVTSPQQNAQLAPTSEPTLAFTIEAKLFRGSSALVLLVPYRAIAPVADRLIAMEGLDSDTDEGSIAAMHRGMSRVEVEVRAEVGAVEMPIERVLSLAPGDLVSLEVPAAAGVTLWVDETPLERGRPGRSGSRRAVQVLGTGPVAP
jgi:flagellar motor switch protein FliM